MSGGSSWNLKHVLAHRLLRDLIARGRGKDAGVVLVVDPHTSKILSSCLRMHDLLAAGVLVLQNLCLHREKLDLPAVYFLDPNSAEAFELLIDDFPKPPPVVPPPHVSAMTHALQALSLTSTPTVAPKSTKQICQYASGHLFFTGPVPAERMKQLQASHIDMRKIKSFVELNVDFLAFESRVFHLDQPHWIPRLYFGEAAENGPSKAVLAPLVTQLMGLLSTILPKNEQPYVRYISDELDIGKTFVSRQLATLVDRAITKQFKEATVAATAGGSATGGLPSGLPPVVTRNTTLLIVDRSLDPLTPLMHEFTFQAMVNDLLKVTGSEIAHLAPKQQLATDSPGATMTTNTKAELQKQLAAMKAANGKPPIAPSTAEKKDDASVGGEDSNEVVLSEEDALWVEYRHRHIGEVMMGVNRKIKEFASSNKMAQFQHTQAQLMAAKKNANPTTTGGGAKESVKDVIRAVADMPEYRLAMRRFTKHVSLAQECLDKFRARSLQQVGELEQCLATNTNVEGKIYKSDSRELRDRLKEIVVGGVGGGDEPRRSISVLDKLRLIAIYAIVQGGIPPPLMQVLSSSLHPKLLQCIVGANLSEFGVDIESFTSQLSRARVQELLERNESQSLALMRYTPSLQSIMEGLVSNTLPIEQFPYTKSGARKTLEEEEEEVAEQERTSHHHHDTAGKGSGSSSRNGSAGSSANHKKDAASAGASSSTTKDNKSSSSGLLHSATSSPSSSHHPDQAAELRARAKVLEEAEKDVAHRATGKSFRRRVPTAEREVAAADSSAMTAPTTSLDVAAMEDQEKPRQLSASSSSAGGGSFGPSPPPAHRYIVFVLGGLTFGEMRSTYEVAQQRGAELIVGSTAPLTPPEFLLDLSGLTRKEFHARVAASAAVAQAHKAPTHKETPTPAAKQRGPTTKESQISSSSSEDSDTSDSSSDSESDASGPPSKASGKVASASTGAAKSKSKRPEIIREAELKFDSEEDTADADEEEPAPTRPPTTRKVVPAAKPPVAPAGARTPAAGKSAERAEREPAPRPPRTAR